MCCKEILVDVVIPLLAAAISGLITFLGVRRTINAQKEAEIKARKDSIKPWLYAKYCVNKGASLIDLKSGDNCTSNANYLYLKNTDNGIAIVDSVTTEKNIYKPVSNCVIDKNSEAQVAIHFLTNGTETMKDAHLRIRDVDGNIYTYEMIWGMDSYNRIVEITTN